MTRPCPPPDPFPKRPTRPTLGPGACDTHGHVFGPAAALSVESAAWLHATRCFAGCYEALHAALGVARGVLTQPSVYGTDNSCMLDYVGKNLSRMRAVVSVDPGASDRELEVMHAQGARGIRVNVDWVPDAYLRERILVENAAALYGF